MRHRKFSRWQFRCGKVYAKSRQLNGATINEMHSYSQNSKLLTGSDDYKCIVFDLIMHKLLSVFMQMYLFLTTYLETAMDTIYVQSILTSVFSQYDAIHLPNNITVNYLIMPSKPSSKCHKTC